MWAVIQIILFATFVVASQGSIPFDELASASVTAIVAASDNECSSLISQLTTEKCFDDIVVMSSSNKIFFMPLMARNTPDCFDFAMYADPFQQWPNLDEGTSGSFFKETSLVSGINYLTLQGDPELVIQLESDGGQTQCWSCG
uniref:Uncharacterized protein n=1 Tax=Palpitomonas bilix TaxID=652834 RepID=A0A7S3GCV7_9EUKA|mmetsp:Transcript_43829/g.114318  ORF Transcript_43829/g.114318 Transcript_43829/m.114318 type:complete len:143 (+) Transcript_43829:43-471(+)